MKNIGNNLSKKLTVIGVSSTLILSSISSATAETKNYDVNNFSRIKVSNGIHVTLNAGKDQSISAEGPDGEMERLSISVKNDTLIVRMNNKRRWGFTRGKNKKYTVSVNAENISSIDVSSGAHVNASSLKGPIVLDSSSGAHIRAEGECTTLSADASSGSHIKAEDLKCNRVTADVSSGAHINVYADNQFTGDASSGGHINVDGSPEEVTTDKSSGGRINLN